MSEEKVKKETKTTKTEATKGGSGKVIVVIFALVAVAIGGVYMTGGFGGGSNSTEVALNNMAPASADPAVAGEGDPVVATIDGKEVKRSEVFSFIGNLPEQTRQQVPVDNLFPMALNQVVNNKLLEMKAEGAGLNNDAEVSAIVEEARVQAVRNIFLQRQVKEHVTEQKIAEAYKELLSSVEGVKETKASHILLEDEAKAKALIVELDGGADFVELAKANSTGPTGPNGGDLGYFAQAEMVPEFANAAFGLEVGKHSVAPVKTQFGWHVIKVMDRRDREAPALEAIKPQLEGKLQQQALGDLITKWKAEVQIKTFDINGAENVVPAPAAQN